MKVPPTFETIPAEALLRRVAALYAERCRLVQIGATRLPDTLQVNYSFDRGGQLVNLRLLLPPDDARVPSISSIYWCAFIYENELHDLFKLHVDGMAIDFQGKFYETSMKYAFGSSRPPKASLPPAVKPASPVEVVRREAPATAPVAAA